MTSQNVTLSAKDWSDIERIKPMLLDRKSQLEMSIALGLRRETVNRKIQRWVQTEDFETWLKTAWVEKYQKVDDRTAFDALTKLLGKMVTQKREIKQEITEDIHEQIDVNIYNDDEKSILDRAARLLERKGTRESSGLH